MFLEVIYSGPVISRMFHACSGAHPDTPANAPSDLKVAEVEGEQAKKRRGRKKSKLEDAFPGYLQVRRMADMSEPVLWTVGQPVPTEVWLDSLSVSANTGGFFWEDPPGS